MLGRPRKVGERRSCKNAATLCRSLGLMALAGSPPPSSWWLQGGRQLSRVLAKRGTKHLRVERGVGALPTDPAVYL